MDLARRHEQALKGVQVVQRLRDEREAQGLELRVAGGGELVVVRRVAAEEDGVWGGGRVRVFDGLEG